MTSEQSAFFTIDHGSATTAAALIGRLGARWRLLSAGAVPAGVPDDVLLEDLVRRVRRADPTVPPRPPGDTSRSGIEATDWRDWSRVSCRTSAPPSIVLAAGSERSLAAVERAFADAGWRIAARITPDRLDAVAATEMLLAGEATTIALAGGPDDGGGLAEIAALVAAAAAGLEDTQVLLVGHEAAAVDLPPGVRRSRLPGPSGLSDGRAPSGDDLASAASRAALAASGLVSGEAPASGTGAAPTSGMIDGAEIDGAAIDGRSAFRRGVASLAAVLDLFVDGVDLGLNAATRVIASPDGVEGAAVRADAGLLPVARPDPYRRDTVAREDEGVLQGIVDWSALRDDGESLRDRVRNLRLAPWRDATGDGARLRLAAARAALSRLDAAWSAGSGRVPGSSSPDLLVASGGCFAPAPPPAVALALIDAIRRPGAIVLALDHARILAPLGALADEGDRRRLLADLVDDILLPLAGALLIPGLRPGRRAVLRIANDGSSSEIALEPGAVQVIDLPPGLVASAEVEAPDEFWVGVRARRVSVQVTGGLGGLLVDTRDIPLRLPERADRRREVLDAWQRPLWTGGDA